MNKSTHIESSSKQAIKELVVISLVTTLVLLLSSLFRSFGRFGNWFEAPHQLDEVFVPASILIFAFGIYAHRRWCELKRVIELREKAEASLQQREEQYLSLLNKQELREANERAIMEYDRLLERLAILAQSIGTARDLSTIYQDLHTFAVVSTDCKAMFISLYDSDKAELSAVYGYLDGKEADLNTLSSLHLSITNFDNLVAHGRSWAADQKPQQVEILGDSQISTRLPRRSLVTPMLMKDRVVGAIELQSLQPWSFRHEHVTAMQMAANLAANAIENVRLLEREREQEQQLRQSQKMEAIGQLAGGVAHDFNNLLTAITGYSELALRKLPEDRPVRTYAEEIDKAARRATSLTRQLLAFSRRQILQPRIVDLNIVVGEMSKMLRRLIGENIDFAASLAPDLLPIKADPGQLEQVIMNLVVNARDSLPAGGKITIETRQVYLDGVYTAKHISVQPGHYAVVAVSDNGVGMDGETQKRIFDPFFTTKEMGKGTGLGLSTVYGIVKQSGGNIWVYSELGLGTTFKVYLPTIDQTPTPEELKPLVVARGNETILLVEDEQIVRELSRKILEEQGYSVITAANGREALKICQNSSDSIDLLITDVVMPFMGGSELAEVIGSIKPEIKVIYMSGYTDEGIVRQGLLDRDISFLQKPFSPDSLVLKTRDLLDAISAN